MSVTTRRSSRSCPRGHKSRYRRAIQKRAPFHEPMMLMWKVVLSHLLIPVSQSLSGKLPFPLTCLSQIRVLNFRSHEPVMLRRKVVLSHLLIPVSVNVGKTSFPIDGLISNSHPQLSIFPPAFAVETDSDLDCNFVSSPIQIRSKKRGGK